MTVAVGAAYRAHPVRELLSVAHRGGEAHEARRLWGVDDHFLPHRAPVGVLQVVDFVEDHIAKVAQRVGARVDHVAQDLGRHHDDRRVAVDRVVAGEQADVGAAMTAHQVDVLLIRQRLDGRRVERLRALGECTGRRVLRDDRLPRGGRCSDEHRFSGIYGVERADLEVVEAEAVAGDECGAQRPRVDRRHAGAGALRMRCRSTSFPITIEIS